MTTFLTFATLLKHATAEKYVGCLLNEGVCDDSETCFDDYAFGRCVSASDVENGDLYRFPVFSAEEETFLENEMSRLYENGFVWTDDYTQCVLQTALAAIRDQIDYDIELCEVLLTQETSDILDEEDNDQTFQPPPPDKYIMADPILLPEEEGQIDDNNSNNNIYNIEEDRPTEDEKIIRETEVYNPSLNQQTLPASLPSISLRNVEEPIELQGIENLPLQRSKLYKVLDEQDRNYIGDYENGDRTDIDYAEEPIIILNDDGEILLENPEDLQEPEDYLDDPKEYSFGQAETFDDYDQNSDNSLESNDVLFDRKERMDVKKPGPFFEASPNNFYLDKLIDRYDTEDDDVIKSKQTADRAAESSKKDDEIDNKSNLTKNNNGQREEELTMSTSNNKEKRTMAETDMPNKDYVHIALNNKLRRWGEGSDFINTVAEALGLPEHALSDRTIEKQHVQFKVEPNQQDVDAAKIAEALNGNISVQKRISGTAGVDIAQAAAGEKEDRASVFPHGRNLNLLILVVVGASVTASLVVGGLIFALASRRQRCGGKKKVSKLQLSEDIEERGKLQEEYKQLCRDWSKSSSQTPASESANKKPVSTTVGKLQGQVSNGSDRSSTSSWPDEPVNNSMDISTGHMVLAYMEDHLKNKQRLEQEWVSLCGYEAEPSSTTVAFKAENKKKNRYPDKLPYDHNRVILNALVNATNSDYINASTVTDHDPRNPSFIVTQGPLGQTTADFWQMVWEQGCVVIVMLTRLQDNGCQLCTRYWPEEGSEQYHIFEVHLVSEHVWCEDYLVRSVYLKNTRTGETRTVTQFHFRSWPAHGVPSSTKALLEFRRKVNKSYRGRSCPIVVHCSDGVGRSGTYVLIDMVLNRLSKGCKEIDIAATLEHIRDQRGGMVQNRQQFEFCLMAVAEEVHAILKALPQ